MTDEATDILILGTGAFAARILFDLAATAKHPLRITIAGRNAMRLDWLRTAANARAAMFRTPARISTAVLEIEEEAVSTLLAARRPRVVVNAASVQAGRVISGGGNAWVSLVAACGLSTTATFQARLSIVIARAVAATIPGASFINCCYPDVVNGMIAGLGLPITSGIGNIAILANAFAGSLGCPTERLRLIAQYQTLAPFRRLPGDRAGGRMPRVWLDGAELTDVAARFADVQLTAEPVIDISGASGVPMFEALVTGEEWRGHVPGPRGLPGGYPVLCRDGQMSLDLPDGITEEEAVTWNGAFEAENGLVIGADRRVRYTGKLAEALAAVSPTLAPGYSLDDLPAADAEMVALRQRLEAIPA